MQLYSSRPRQLTWQVIADVAAIATLVASIWLSQQVRHAIESLGAFGTHIQDAGADFATTMQQAGESLEQIPLLGPSISQPFIDASGSADDLSAAGVALQASVDALAAAVSTTLWLLPALLLVLVWLVPRLRFAVRATSTSRVAWTPGGRDLLALRAVIGQPAAAVLAAVPDPVAALRSGDARALQSLAELELRSTGVRARPTGVNP